MPSSSSHPSSSQSTDHSNARPARHSRSSFDEGFRDLDHLHPEPLFADPSSGLNLVDPSQSLDLPFGLHTAALQGGNPPNHQQSEHQDMSSLGFMMPAHYGSFGPYASNYDTSNYEQTHHSSPQQQSYTQSSGTPSPYLPPYQQPSAVLRSSPQNDYAPRHASISSLTSSASGGYIPVSAEGAAAHTSPYPPIHPNLPAPNTTLPYGSNYPGSPNQYSTSGYAVAYGPPATSAAPMYAAPPTSPYSAPYAGGSAGDPSSAAGADRGVRVLNSRPKPQCWEHGCNGRQFSTFSNLLRHQREKSGTAAKSYCPRCGAEFTRTTARNGHMAHEKCKPRKTSDAS